MTRKNRPPRNRRKSARYRAAKKARVVRKFKKSPHGRRMKRAGSTQIRS